jgi:hypothetical protein
MEYNRPENYGMAARSYGPSALGGQIMGDVPVSAGILDSLISLAIDLVKMQVEIAGTARSTADRVLGPRPEKDQMGGPEVAHNSAVETLRYRLMTAQEVAQEALAQVRRFEGL